MNQNIKIILFVGIIACIFVSGVSAFKSSSCSPGASPVHFMTHVMCYPCGLGTYCPDGKNWYKCPPGTIAPDLGLTHCENCVNGTRPDEESDACLAKDTPHNSKFFKQFEMKVIPSPNGLAYFYIVRTILATNTVKFRIEGQTSPVTIYMSHVSGAPGPQNFDVMATSTSPTMTINKAGVISYFAIKISNPVTISFTIV